MLRALRTVASVFGVLAIVAPFVACSSSNPTSEPGPDAGGDTAPSALDGGSSTEGGRPPGTDAGKDAAPATDAETPDAGGDASHAHTGKWRIMPLGDSITGNTCYPQLLSAELIAKGHSNFEFIGTNLNNQDCGPNAPFVTTEGHGGYLATFLLTNNPPIAQRGTLAELQQWVTEKPDVVLMEIGTNDVWNGTATADIVDAYGFIVDQFRGQKADVIFFVAQITPMHPDGCTACEPGVEALNAKIPAWAAGKATAASPIHVVNVWSQFDPAAYLPNSTDTADGVHPTPAGAQKMADVWEPGITGQGLP